MTLDFDLDHLADVVFVKFLHNKVSFYPPFYTVIFGGKSLCPANTEGARNYSPLP